MKVELHINGRLNIELTPETSIERTVLGEILEHAVKGKAVRITSGHSGEAAEGQTVVVSVES
jgi:hypothetical protein